MSEAHILGVHPCDDTAQVVTLKGEGRYRKTPCPECPWRKNAPIGAWPAEAYRHSAATCADAALNTFACHLAQQSHPQTCAGFLLSKHAVHNLGVRLALMRGRLDLSKVSSPAPLFRSYVGMAVANGVDPDDPALAQVREG